MTKEFDIAQNSSEYRADAISRTSHLIAAAIDAKDANLAEISSVFLKLLKESETGQVLVFGTYLEERLKEVIFKTFPSPNRKSLDSDLFGTRCSLGNHYDRIKFSEHMLWLTDDLVKGLTAFNAVRREFAHRAYRVSFADQAINAQIENIFKSQKSFWDRVDRDVQDRMTPLQRRLISFAVLCAKAHDSILVLSTVGSFLSAFVDPEIVQAASKVLNKNEQELQKTFELISRSGA